LIQLERKLAIISIVKMLRIASTISKSSSISATDREASLFSVNQREKGPKMQYQDCKAGEQCA
jgi:hypothetical protein